MMDFLFQEIQWLKQHEAPMHSVQTTIAGWFSCQHNPDVCHFPTLQDNINSEISSYSDTNKEELLKLAGHQAALRNWDGANTPVISAIQVKPFWTKNINNAQQQWNTRATGVICVHCFGAIVCRIVSAIHWTKTAEKSTFIDTTYRHAGRDMAKVYSQAITDHQAYLKNRSFQVIEGITRQVMNHIEVILQNIPSAITVQPTNNTDKVGQWRLLVNKEVSTPRLKNIEEAIQNAPKSNPQVLNLSLSG